MYDKDCFFKDRLCLLKKLMWIGKRGFVPTRCLMKVLRELDLWGIQGDARDAYVESRVEYLHKIYVKRGTEVREVWQKLFKNDKFYGPMKYGVAWVGVVGRGGWWWGGGVGRSGTCWRSEVDRVGGGGGRWGWDGVGDACGGWEGGVGCGGVGIQGGWGLGSGWETGAGWVGAGVTASGRVWGVGGQVGCELGGGGMRGTGVGEMREVGINLWDGVS
ncbi:hypothetical protein Tco_1564212 [Tanacetum coccineum]